jgi:hypothetical protein
VTPEELYALWAPQQLIWSQWVIPVPFAQMTCLDEKDQSGSIEGIAANALVEAASDLAIVADLPGGEAIRFGSALAQRGFRPVPIIDGSPGPFLLPVAPSLQRSETKGKQIVVVDMSDLLAALCEGGTFLQTVSLPAHAPPAFLVDSMRMTGEGIMDKEVFDNRWKIVPQDFPSAQFLKGQGIGRVLLVHEPRRQPQEDLAHVLRRWQEAGIVVLVSDKEHTQSATWMPVDEPLGLRATWYRMLEILGLRRNSVGGFGAWPYQGAFG